MSDPFENYPKYPSADKSYTSFVRSQISSLEIGKSKKVKLGGAGHSKFRSSLNAVAKKLNMKFKTKCNSDGELWVLRYK
ncbi:hypothetical protein MYOV065v1_p0009 [Vibrio phage PS15B.2]|nr:hypothetical protein MYOV065v1_p0009 [Vibrio phage PS15B.2]QZI90859.1 hypothetical protein MYOV064v1_p0009 [Vibrio phage PS15B.4]